MANNTGAFGTALRGAADEMLGLNDAAQANADMTPEMIEAQQQEQEELKKQAELEEKAAEAYGKVSSSMAEIKDYINDLNAEYEANYQAAYDNINKQIGLFDEMTVGTSKSVDSMLKSLDSQISYMDNYASNMRKAAELGIDEGLLAKLNDGSQESAEILQGIVDDGGEHIEELNEKLAMVEEGKQTFADTYAEIKTGLDDDLKDMIASVEGMVDDLDQSAEAYKNGSMTAQGFIDGCEAKYDQVYNAYKKMAERANRAVKNTMDINSPSRVMMQFGEYSGEGFAEGALKELNTVEGAYEKLAKAAMSPLESLDPFGSPTGYAAGDGGYTDNRNMNVQISVASGSPEDMQKVYDYISREFATRSGRRIS
jgi:methyl-accepting chemotaxis protein